MPDSTPPVSSLSGNSNAKATDSLRYMEKLQPRNTVYNETVRADNRRMDRGEPTKPLPRGKSGDKIWKRKEGRKGGR